MTGLAKPAPKRRLLLAGAALLLALLLLLQPVPTARRAPQVGAKVEAGVVVRGFVRVYVGGALVAEQEMHSFVWEYATRELAARVFPVPWVREWAQPLTVTWGVSDDSQGLRAATMSLKDTKGSKWGDAALDPPVFAESGFSVSASFTAPHDTNISVIEIYQPYTDVTYWDSTAYPAVVHDLMVRDYMESPVPVAGGSRVTVTYDFVFESDQPELRYEIFTYNWYRMFAAWLYNAGNGKVNVTATDGSQALVDPTRPTWDSRARNVPVDTFIVVGDGQVSFSKSAFRVAREVARAEPVVIYDSHPPPAGSVVVTRAFVFDRDVNVTEVAVYVRLTDGKEVMLLYHVLGEPVAVKAGQPFTVTFRVYLVPGL